MTKMKKTTEAKFKEALEVASLLFVQMSKGKTVVDKKTGQIKDQEMVNDFEYVRGRFLWGLAGNCHFNIKSQQQTIHKTTEELRAGIIPGATHGLSDYMVERKLNFIEACEDQKAEWENAFKLCKEVYQEQTGKQWQTGSTQTAPVDRTANNDRLKALGLPTVAEPATDGTLSEPKVA